MKIEVHFYTKHLIALNFVAEKTYGDHDHELLLYAWFTLRQLHNQGHHLVADVFAGLVASDRYNTVNKLLLDKPQIPDAVELLVQAQNAKFPKGDTSLEKSMAGSQVLTRFALPSSPERNYAELINQQILSEIPELINYPGKPGDKQFIGTVPPPNFQFKGFGLLGTLAGKDIPYYAFQSLLASLKFFARRYSTDAVRLKRLSFVADACGHAHMKDFIKAGEQLDLAAFFVQKSEEVE